MKNVMKLAAFVMAVVMVLGLVACGSGSDDTFSVTSREPIDLGTVSGNDSAYSSTGNGTENNTDNTVSIDLNSTITLPDLELDGGIEEKATFVVPETEGISGKVEIYHKDDVIKSITMTTTNTFDGYTEDQMKQIREEADASFAEFNKNDFVSYSCTTSGNSATIVIAMRNLDQNGNQAKVAEQEMFDSLEADTTYSEFAAILTSGGFVEQK